MTDQRRMTLKDLAQELNVSTATISNAFNRPDQLSPALRERILKEAKRLGYSGPDAKARSLRTGRSRIIAVILAESLTYSLNDAVASEFLSGVAEVLDAHGHTLLLLPGRGHASQPPGSANIADGFIVYGLMPNNKLLDELPAQRTLVAVDFDIEGCPTVHIDDTAASYKIAQHALNQLPKRPAIINLRLTKEVCNGRVTAEHTLLPNTSTISRARLEGFHNALSEQGVDVAQVPLWNIEENTFEVCSPVIAEILDQPLEQRPDLLLCMSDRIALTALTLAEQRGIRVPEELRITGFDGIAEGQYRAPRLTTVRQDSVGKGRVAAQMILGRIPLAQQLLQTELLLGDTCP
ncbi:LacI family DNA-binding transcriptional regulator [Vreelandella titanicae]|uniref:Transcription regulator HTH, LacI n=3 Tax=Oceanospirillales TaxID=135619 RepID=L9UB43_9GAMM|nr:MULTISPECIES: LacI family DNA-binding transcriptional regulator [Halomonas]ELY21851.1 Transcription regulator HTH, LacI [Halomonas titanicae BH1]UEQ02357.1 LacI family DNA-binding transcriptional regulator [Halomonas profundus]